MLRTYKNCKFRNPYVRHRREYHFKSYLIRKRGNNITPVPKPKFIAKVYNLLMDFLTKNNQTNMK